MSLVQWRKVAPQLQELQAQCYYCRQWKPYGESIPWVNILALTWTYVCIDCLSDPVIEAGMRVYGWSQTWWK